jgi:hypothetical protein
MENAVVIVERTTGPTRTVHAVCVMRETTPGHTGRRVAFSHVPKQGLGDSGSFRLEMLFLKSG